MTQSVTSPLTLSGRYFSKKELIGIQQTIKTFPDLSLTELAQTICEHLSWTTERGRNKHNACLDALAKLEKLGLVELPSKRLQKKRKSKKVIWTEQSETKPDINCSLAELGTITLKVVTDKAEVTLWNESVDRHHYLGYKHPIGAALKYFIMSEGLQPQILGCLLFSASVWHLADRDQWIGWDKKDREKRLNLVINNNRFLIFPWVNVPNLASKALALVTRQIRDDWQIAHGYRPVLIETFVDDSQYLGTCYQAVNWECIGKSSGKDWQADASEKSAKASVKSIWVTPLHKHFRAILNNQQPAKAEVGLDESFVALWGKVVLTLSDVAQEFDAKWQKRKRVIDSLLLVFLIFRLVFSKNSQGYGTTIEEFWHNCLRMQFPLPQKKPISASSFSEARKKLDEAIFKVLNQRIITAHDTLTEPDEQSQRWLNHRLFAVDGSKLNLPRELIEQHYRTPSKEAHYPQGLLSCLYQLKSKIPYDFDLVNHGNERKCALAHLKSLTTKDVVVYDRGYFSYAMLYYHIERGVHPIFRLQKNTFKAIDDFRNSTQSDQIITLLPAKETQREIHKLYPDIQFKALTFRLVKYTLEGKTYCIGTTLIDERYPIEALKEVYHARWGIEELYKISKDMLVVDDFHGRSERTVKQELFAHFVLITMSRLCTNESESLLNSLLNIKPDEIEPEKTIQANFKNSLATMSRHLEDIMFVPARCIKSLMDDIVSSISRNYRKLRPGRSYDRKSKKPVNKWRGCESTA